MINVVIITSAFVLVIASLFLFACINEEPLHGER